MGKYIARLFGMTLLVLALLFTLRFSFSKSKFCTSYGYGDETIVTCSMIFPMIPWLMEFTGDGIMSMFTFRLVEKP